MDLIIYLKNTNNEELYQKLKDIVNLYKEREKNKKLLISLNAEYNEYLTEKHEREQNKKKENKKDFKNPFEEIINANPFLLFWLVMLLPPQLLLIALIAVPFIFGYKITHKKIEYLNKFQDDCMEFVNKWNQEVKYDLLCNAREAYHTKRKELDKAMQCLNKDDLNLISEFYGCLSEYEALLDSIIQEEANIELPQETTNKALEYKNN